MTYVLKLFNTGQVTLPKKWRTQVKTKNFIATERDGGLFIEPIHEKTDNITYYENPEGFGIYSESGIEPDEIIARIKSLQNG